MRIALDATYSIDRHPSGIAVYSREMLEGLAREHPADSFLHCYRLKQFRNASVPAAKNVRRRPLVPPLPTFRADLFHALNQRVDKRPAAKVVSTFHDLFVLTEEYSAPDFRSRFSDQARRAAENSDLIITVSEFTAKQVHDVLGFPETRIRVVPHGVRMAPGRKTSGTREKSILFVGALQTRKNVIRIVEAFEAISCDWRLILAGSTSGYGADQILRRIESSHSRDRIEVTGYIDGIHLQKLYSAASIFAFPSMAEGFGMPVLEAMASGIPVITSNNSALAEVAGGAAYLVNPGSTGEITEALKRLTEDSELREALRDLGLERASQFSWQSAVRETYAVYEELLA